MGLRRWLGMQPTQHDLFLASEEPDERGWLGTVPAYIFDAKRPQPAEENLTVEPDGIPTSDLYVRTYDYIGMGIGLPGKAVHANLTVRTRNLGEVIAIGVFSLLLGIPAVALGLISQQPVIQALAVVGWLGVVALTVVLRLRERRPGDPEAGQR